MDQIERNFCSRKWLRALCLPRGPEGSWRLGSIAETFDNELYFLVTASLLKFFDDCLEKSLSFLLVIVLQYFSGRI